MEQKKKEKKNLNFIVNVVILEHFQKTFMKNILVQINTKNFWKNLITNNFIYKLIYIDNIICILTNIKNIKINILN
jgi:hypothetical protein